MHQRNQLESIIDAVYRAVQQRLGPGSDPQLMHLVVREVVAAMTQGEGAPDDITRPREDPAQPGVMQRSRAVVTASGRNGKGQVAGVAQTIADAGGDIMDLSQTIVADFFTMIMVVDISQLSFSFAQFKTSLSRAAEGLGIHVTVMHEDVLRALQRV